MAICGTDCCEKCERRKECGGCEACGGHPFGGSCTAAELIVGKGKDAYLAAKQKAMDAINALGIPGLHVEELYLLIGAYVNLSYPLPNGTQAQFLQENRVYWGNQIEIEGQERCYGVVADTDFVLACSYGKNGSDPELLAYCKY